jgi:hypothetical protein
MTPLIHKNEIQFWVRTISILVNMWTDVNWLRNENCAKYWMAIEKVNLSGYYGPVKFSIWILNHTKSAFYKIWFVNVNHDIFLVIPWRPLTSLLHYTYAQRNQDRNIQHCSSWLLWTDLQGELLYCREHKKLTIRHNLYLKIWTDKLL